MDNFFHNRMTELAERSFQENKYVFSDFLSETEKSDLLSMEREVSYAGMKLFGGTEDCARVVVRFGDFDREEAFPIVCVKIAPKSKKFADVLTHRDFLGALLSLGIERSTLGDITIKDNVGYCFCLKRIAPFLMENLTSVRHTEVTASLTEEAVTLLSERKAMQTQVASLRCDCVICAAYDFSRAEILEYFRTEKISVNGRVCTENAKELKEGDCVAVRGMGKFFLTAVGSTTRKGKLHVTIEKPI